MGVKGNDVMIPESRKRVDYNGEYDLYAIPWEFEAPLKSDPQNNAIACANGKVLGTYNFINESVFLAHAKRRAEFAVMLANGEIILHQGTVLKNVGRQVRGDRVILTYAPLDQAEEVTEESLPEPEEEKPGIVAKAKAALKRRTSKK